MTLEYCHCLQDPSCTLSCSATTRLHYQGLSLSPPFLPFLLLPPSMTLYLADFFFLQLQGSATRAYLCSPCLPFLLLPPSMSHLNFFFLQLQGLLPFSFCCPINDATASWFSFQESGEPCEPKQNGHKVIRNSKSPRKILSMSLPFLWLSQFCPCFSESTCTAQPVLVSSVPVSQPVLFSSVLVALHPPVHFVPLEKWEL